MAASMPYSLLCTSLFLFSVAQADQQCEGADCAIKVNSLLQSDPRTYHAVSLSVDNVQRTDQNHQSFADQQTQAGDEEEFEFGSEEEDDEEEEKVNLAYKADESACPKCTHDLGDCRKCVSTKRVADWSAEERRLNCVMRHSGELYVSEDDDKMYTLGQMGVSTCPSGYNDITDSVTCKIATKNLNSNPAYPHAPKLWRYKQGKKTPSDGVCIRKCAPRTSFSRIVASGTSTPVTAMICKKAPAPAPPPACVDTWMPKPAKNSAYPQNCTAALNKWQQGCATCDPNSADWNGQCFLPGDAGPGYYYYWGQGDVKAQSGCCICGGGDRQA